MVPCRHAQVKLDYLASLHSHPYMPGRIMSHLDARVLRTATWLEPRIATVDDSGLDTHQWRAVLDYQGSWSGRVLIQMASAQELHKLHSALHGKGVQVQAGRMIGRARA